jgi:hypothetical protein
MDQLEKEEGPASNQKEQPLDNIKKWEIGRRHIEHEDNLVNHRLTWLLLLQGFLFTALASAVGALKDLQDGTRFILVIFVLVLASLGIALSWVARYLVEDAYTMLEAINQWWDDQEVKGYPRFSGYFLDPDRRRIIQPAAHQDTKPSYDRKRSRILGKTTNIPTFFIWAWLSVIFLTLASVIVEQVIKNTGSGPKPGASPSITPPGKSAPKSSEETIEPLDARLH